MIDELLQAINQTHGTTFTLQQRYADGEQGAFALTDAAGEAYVLKVNPDPSAAERLRLTTELAGRLRARGSQPSSRGVCAPAATPPRATFSSGPPHTPSTPSTPPCRVRPCAG